MANPSGVDDDRVRRAVAERRAAAGIAFGAGGGAGSYEDGDLAAAPRDVDAAWVDGGGDGGRGGGADDDIDEGIDAARVHPATRASAHGLASHVVQQVRAAAASGGPSDEDLLATYRAAGGSRLVDTRIAAREDSYHARRRNLQLSPERTDAFAAVTAAAGGASAPPPGTSTTSTGGGEEGGRSYAEVMRHNAVERERAELQRKLAKQQEQLAIQGLTVPVAAPAPAPPPPSDGGAPTAGRKRRRWDDGATAVSTVHDDAASVVTAASTIASGGAGGGADGGALSVAAASSEAAPRRRRGWDTGSVEVADAAAATSRAPRWGESQTGSSAARGSAVSATHSAWGDDDAGASELHSAWAGGAGAGAGADSATLPAGAVTPGADALALARGRYGGVDDEGDGDEDMDVTAALLARRAASSSGAALSAAAASAAAAAQRAKRSRWDETPAPGLAATWSAGGETPAALGAYGSATPAARGSAAATPFGMSGATPTPSALLAAGAATPAAGMLAGAVTPAASALNLAAMTPDQVVRARADAEMDARNRPLTDEELDTLLPAAGYRILEPPATYVPLRTPSRKLTATPTPAGATGFRITDTPDKEAYGIPLAAPDSLTGSKPAGMEGGESDLPFVRPEDMQYFGALLDATPIDMSDKKAVAHRTIMELLLKIKNGTPPQRRTSIRKLVDRAREFGAGALFDQLLPLLMAPSLEDQERHVLVKVVDRLLFKLDELVRPYVHKVLMVIEPMLIDEDYYARVEGREIVSNLAKAAGLASMISVMRPDIDHVDEYVRNTTSRAFAVVASALGIPAMLPFLKAVCASRKTWQARHTGVKVIQQMAILMGCAVLPHLKPLVETVAPALSDDNLKVRIMAALAVAALAEASHPYGIEAFDSVLRPLLRALKENRGKSLAAVLKAVGCVIPLMDAAHAGQFTRTIMPIVVREFGSADEEMKRIVLKVIMQLVGTDGVDAPYVRSDVLPPMVASFWVARMAEDRRNYRALVDATVKVAEKVGAADVIRSLNDCLKDESEPFRRMAMEAVDKVITLLGSSDVDDRLEEQLLDGMLYAFQEMTSDDSARTILATFATVVNALGPRCKPYLPQMAGTIKWRLNNKAPQIRMHAADLMARVAAAMKSAGEDGLLAHLGVVLYECLGEEFPEVLGSILGGLTAIVAVIGMEHMQPPIKDLLPRLTPILRNRNEKVQEAAIDLVGRIADRGHEGVSAREWMRICFELLEMLKAPRKSIRRACNNTFGYIAKAIGPQDVMHALLNNLKVQERQLRLCTTIAIAIVAETCQPFTVLPALLNEYRVPDVNVQHGVLKALSFMFEYIGPLARDYVYAVTPLLQDALMERDLLHRQTACFAVKHLTLGLQGLGCEDALTHLLNYVWPNIFETTPHLLQAMFETTEAMRVSLGAGKLLQYAMQGLFHPARRVREAFWRIYNNLYVYGAHSLTPAYPRIRDDTFGMVQTAEADGAGGGGEGGEEAVELALWQRGPGRYTRTHLELLL